MMQVAAFAKEILPAKVVVVISVVPIAIQEAPWQSKFCVGTFLRVDPATTFAIFVSGHAQVSKQPAAELARTNTSQMMQDHSFEHN